jgi:hypothetical protein
LQPEAARLTTTEPAALSGPVMYCLWRQAMNTALKILRPTSLRGLFLTARQAENRLFQRAEQLLCFPHAFGSSFFD